MCTETEVGREKDRHSSAKDSGACSVTGKREILLLSCRGRKLHTAQGNYIIAQKTFTGR